MLLNFNILLSSSPNSLTLSPSLSQISPRSSPTTVAAGVKRSKRRRRPPPENMSVTVPMSFEDEPFVSSSRTRNEASKNVPKKNRYSMSSISCFGVELTPDNIAISMVYFVQGVLGLARLAVSFYFKDDLHLDPAETAVITGFSALPWLIKPLYGFISDSVPLFGYRRRSYLVLSGLLGALSWSLMATFVDDKYGAAFCILLGSLSVAFSDVVVDSMVVERARGETQSVSGSLQSLCWGSSAFGGIVSSYFSGSLVDAYGVRALQVTVDYLLHSFQKPYCLRG